VEGGQAGEEGKVKVEVESRGDGGRDLICLQPLAEDIFIFAVLVC